MPQSNRSLYLVIGLILIINLVLLSRIGNLNNRLETISDNYRNLQSSLDSISGNVNNTLTQFTKEQSWITPAQVNSEKSKLENEQQLAVLNWQIKDFPEGAEVVFHYRESEFGEFKALPAENKGTGFFEVNIPLTIKAEPFWEIQVSQTESIGKRTSERVVTKPESVQSVGYYVSMKVNDNIKSSEVSYFDLAYLTNMKYEPIQGHVDITAKQYNIRIFEHYPNFESIIVKFYEGNNLVTEKTLEVQDDQNGQKQYSLAVAKGSQNISRLVIQVTYSNGNTFEKEISF